jgi:DNA-binding SARP family transcriptional activator
MKPGASFVAAAHGPPSGRQGGGRSPPPGVVLALLESFELRFRGRSVLLPRSAQRVLAFLALHDRLLVRDYVAGMLWLDATEDRAHASLRSALWRLGRPGFPLVEATSRHLRLASGVAVDLREATSLAHRLVDCAAEPKGLEDCLPLCHDVLPDWYEEWVLVERERFRQLRLHALDALCEQLTAAGRFAPAIEAGMAAVAAEPLRESAHQRLIEAHLAEGNRGEAIRQYCLCRRLLRDRLGLRPSNQLASLVREL